MNRMKNSEDVYIDEDFMYLSTEYFAIILLLNINRNEDNDNYGSTEFNFDSDSGDDFDYGLDYSGDDPEDDVSSKSCIAFLIPSFRMALWMIVRKAKTQAKRRPR